MPKTPRVIKTAKPASSAKPATGSATPAKPATARAPRVIVGATKPAPKPADPLAVAAAKAGVASNVATAAKPATVLPDLSKAVNVAVTVPAPAVSTAPTIERIAAGHARKQSRHPFAYPSSGIVNAADAEYLAFFGRVCRFAKRTTDITGADIATHAVAAGASNDNGVLRIPSPSGNLKNSITDGGRQSRLVQSGYFTRNAASGNALSATDKARTLAVFAQAYAGK
jgi:hypothetical protein